VFDVDAVLLAPVAPAAAGAAKLGALARYARAAAFAPLARAVAAPRTKGGALALGVLTAGAIEAPPALVDEEKQEENIESVAELLRRRRELAEEKKDA